jgi:mono/diheme cytochrome c family protein
MKRIERILLGIALLFFAAPALLSAQTTSTSPDTGTISPVQAKRGENTFKQSCSSCHSVGQFTSAQYVNAWNGRPVFELFEQLRNNMPQDNPGGLSRQEYIDVVLYLFHLNGAAQGEKELPPDDQAMKSTRIRLKGSTN